jgi:hypothetical protein
MRMLRAFVADCVGLLESVTLRVKFEVVSGPRGLPVMRPDAFIARPGGNAPALTVYVKVPKPVATTCWLYAVPSTPAGNVVVVNVGGPGKLMRMLSAWVAVCGVTVLESVTLTVKFAVPAGPVGVPLIVPEVLRVSPAGSAPALTVNVTVPAPPVATTAWLYVVPSTPAGSDVVVIAGAAVTVTVKVVDFVTSDTDVAVITAVPAAPFAL